LLLILSPQDAFRSSFESSIIPSFEQSCKTVFEQIDGAFQKGMSEHNTAIQQQVVAGHTPLAQTLRVSLQSLFLKQFLGNRKM
jgi:enhancer of mRNA-decapping protein 4